jgi:AcrR family transcriptional regulator
VKPTLRERQRGLTRSALLDGARRAFEERGYSAVTVDDITSRAGTSRGTFYLHFTKATVLQALLGEAFGLSDVPGEVANPTNLAVADLSTPAAVRGWLRSYVGVWQTHRLLARAWMEGDAIDPELRAMTDRRIARAVEALTTRIVEAHRARGASIEPEQARAEAALMDLELQYFCYHVVGRDLDVSVEAGLDAMTRHWHSALHGASDRTC